MSLGHAKLAFAIGAMPLFWRYSGHARWSGAGSRFLLRRLRKQLSITDWPEDTGAGRPAPV